MKYNLKKLKDGKIIKFIVKGTTLRDAIFELDICFASEKCDAFQVWNLFHYRFLCPL